jgi:hypothetical protein
VRANRDQVAVSRIQKNVNALEQIVKLMTSAAHNFDVLAGDDKVSESARAYWSDQAHACRKVAESTRSALVAMGAAGHW